MTKHESEYTWLDLVLVPWYALYGIFILVQTLWRVPKKLKSLKLATKDEILCPHGHPNAAIGRFECASCKGIYLGWVGKCSLCGSGASWISCEICGVSTPLPWEHE